MRALKNYFSLSDYTDFKKMIPQIFLYYQCIFNLCNRFPISVIKDFWTFPEIALFFLDREGGANLKYKLKKEVRSMRWMFPHATHCSTCGSLQWSWARR